MTELKTLSDLKTDSANLFCEAVSYKELKQEAVEWIKNSTDQKHWLKFFNLTEEDLEEKE
jgi:hypothetical protein